MSFAKIAFSDFEFSGLDPLRHEIIEFGVVVADAQTLEVVGEMDRKVKMERPETADPASLSFAGYKTANWQDAINLEEALDEYSRLTKEALFAGWIITLDWTFLREAYRAKNRSFHFDYHAIDVMPIAFHEVGLTRLSKTCQHFGIEKEPMPHRAINGARKVYEVYKKLREL